MISPNKMYLVPQIVKDIASSLNESRQVSARAAYVQRLEATRDYIEAVLAIADKQQVVLNK